MLADKGIRPEECFRLRWENVIWSNGRNGDLLVTRGKTPAARRVVPMTARVRLWLKRVGTQRETRRRIGVTSSHAQWTRRAVKRSEAAGECVRCNREGSS